MTGLVDVKSERATEIKACKTIVTQESRPVFFFFRYFNKAFSPIFQTCRQLAGMRVPGEGVYHLKAAFLHLCIPRVVTNRPGRQQSEAKCTQLA